MLLTLTEAETFDIIISIYLNVVFTSNAEILNKNKEYLVIHNYIEVLKFI